MARAGDWRRADTVELDQGQWLFAARLAYARDESYRDSPHFSSSLYRHMQGAAAEVAAASDLGATVDEGVYADGDQGWDFELNGTTVDVKSTVREPPHLLVAEPKAGSADAYLATHVERNRVTLVGAAWASDLEDAADVHGRRRVLVDDLRDWPSPDGIRARGST